MQVLYLGRAPRTKETLPDFREKCRVTRHSRVFRWLTGSQRTPRVWGVTAWSTKRYKACPTCNESTSSQGIRSKICYMGHRRFLPLNHNWRRSRQHDGNPEHQPTPKILSGDDILE